MFSLTQKQIDSVKIPIIGSISEFDPPIYNTPDNPGNVFMKKVLGHKGYSVVEKYDELAKLEKQLLVWWKES